MRAMLGMKKLDLAAMMAAADQTRLRTRTLHPMGGDRVPAAVLWDMDGTLVDTEPYWIASEHALVAEFGGTWTGEDAHSIVGFDLLDAAMELRVRGGVRLEPVEIVERLLDSVIAMASVDSPGAAVHGSCSPNVRSRKSRARW